MGLHRRKPDTFTVRLVAQRTVKGYDAAEVETSVRRALEHWGYELVKVHVEKVDAAPRKV